MKILNLFKSSKGKDAKTSAKCGSFSGFFLNASDKEKKEVIMEAAKRANEEQRKVFEESRMALKR